jgi:hypothetical protein
MNTKNKVLIASGLVIAVIGYYIYKNMKKKPTLEVVETPDLETSHSETPETPVTNIIDKKKVLSFGSKGKEVEELQRKLGGLTPDGDFGSKTQSKLWNTFSLNKITLEQFEKWFPKIQYVITIFPNLTSSYLRTGLYDLDLPFLKAWASAVTKKEPFFKYQTSSGEKIYSSSTGKAQTQYSTLGGLITYF